MKESLHDNYRLKLLEIKRDLEGLEGHDQNEIDSP